MTTQFKKKPTFGHVEFESWTDNDNYVEKQTGEYLRVYFGSYSDAAYMGVESSYIYKSGRTSTHHVGAELSGAQLRELAAKLLEIADQQDAKKSARSGPPLDPWAGDENEDVRDFERG